MVEELYASIFFSPEMEAAGSLKFWHFLTKLPIAIFLSVF
jgi:hypothetical protein